MPHQKMFCSTLILALRVFSILHVAVSQDGGITTCNAPSVGEGQPATVICDFGYDVSTLIDFIITIERYPYDGNDPVEVLSCHSTNNVMKCPTEKGGYNFDRKIGTSLRLSITKASTDNAGRYLCKLDSRNITERLKPEQCFFNLTDTISTTPTDLINGTNKTTGSADDKLPIIIGIAGAVVVIAVIVVVAIVLFRWYRKKRGRPEEERTLEISRLTTNQDQTLNETSRDHEGESNIPPPERPSEQLNPENDAPVKANQEISEVPENPAELSSTQESSVAAANDTIESAVEGAEGTDEADKPLLAGGAKPDADPKV